ncbi:hypothetical protein AX17_001786 [Amanita inopinata Kibby_2008]|nr:hypothetical protein AX17_001786 [Amanita inopinata Kibby_2008]
MLHRSKELEVVTAVCSAVAILSTLIRFVLRRHRLWADDAWALLSTAVLVVQVIAIFTRPRKSSLGVARYYLLASAFYAIIWSARLSLLFSIIRIDPHPRRRRWLYFVASLFLIICILLIGQLYWVCEPEPGWKTLKIPQCHLNLSVAVFQMTTDILADAALLITPVLLFRILSDQWLRYRLIAIFSTCIITTIVSLVHASYVLTTSGVKVEIVGVIENCTSLVVCNIPVIASAALRLRDIYSSRRDHVPSTTINFLPGVADSSFNSGATDTEMGIATVKSRRDMLIEDAHELDTVQHGSKGNT